ncbi:hypothetical protein [Actinokineospora spheciospongiae]|uniref:hypothetical protein n=1 Tax=Actinokineospora spheciospongiae TaxID=909613 RepID=UPI000D71750A|nr:hypothetical protein [Actinokineospora spheciospongiae]PWW53669.1 hypothetical protein DFQ13_11552 [Actinokineospora spheciospongiae]
MTGGRKRRKNRNRSEPYRRLAIALTMDFGVLVLIRFNRTSRRFTCIWGEGPEEEAMRKRAADYVGSIPQLELDGVVWVRSGELLAAVNQVGVSLVSGMW